MDGELGYKVLTWDMAISTIDIGTIRVNRVNPPRVWLIRLLLLRITHLSPFFTKANKDISTTSHYVNFWLFLYFDCRATSNIQLDHPVDNKCMTMVALDKSF